MERTTEAKAGLLRGAHWLDVLAALLMMGAGAYLLTTNTVAENSIFNALLHGLGAYMIGKGIYCARALHLLAGRALD